MGEAWSGRLGGGGCGEVQGAAEWIFYMKTIYFLHTSNFQLLCKIRESSVNNCDFFLNSYFLPEAAIVITSPKGQVPYCVTGYLQVL
jgi:hypothetical protein